MTYSFPYLLLLTFFALLAVLYDHMEDETTRKRINMGALAVFFVFFAFRGYVYTDWQNYESLLGRVEWSYLFCLFDSDSKEMVEPGFVALCMFCKSIHESYPLLVCVCMLINTALFLRFLRQRHIENLALAFMLFITFQGLTIMFNLLRNAISMFLFMNAIQYIEKRKPLPYFALCVAALMFHMSSAVFFPLYFFLDRKLNRWVYLAIAGALMLFFLSKISLVGTALQLIGIGGDKVEAYTENLTSSRGISLTDTLENVGLLTMVMLYYDEILAKHRGHAAIVNSLLMYLFMYYVLAEFKTMSDRFAMLFSYSFWILWIDFIHLLYLKNNRILLSTVLYLYCAFILVRTISTPAQEYDNLLFGAKSMQERQTILHRTYEEDE